jgi:phage terminase large subunit-like protein
LEAICRLVPGYDPFATRFLASGEECYLDHSEARRALGFFRYRLRHIEGDLRGTPLLLGPWQKGIVANLFGWKRPDGTRRYREAFIYVPRKNGKTTLGAGIVLYLLVADGEPGAQVYSTAADREQAAITYRCADGMVEQDAGLSCRVKPFKTYKSLEFFPADGSPCVFKALSADVGTKHGLNVHGALNDELHAHDKRDLIDVIETATGARSQPLIVHITTADVRRLSICNEKREYAINVRDGIFADAGFFPCIYEASVEDDWRDPKVWAKANPNLGVSVGIEEMERAARQAQQVPAKQNTFKRLRLNIRTHSESVWIPVDRWDECRDDDFDAEALAGKPCYGGLDLSSTTDLTAFVLLFHKDGWKALPFFWMPREKALERQDRDNVPYLLWESQGFLEFTEGDVVDQDFILERVTQIAELYRVIDVGVDRFKADYLIPLMGNRGVTCVAFGQGFVSMSDPTKGLERLILKRELGHDGNPVLRWCLANMMVELDAAEGVKPSKKKATERIDGIVALIMATGRALQCAGARKSIYLERGLRSL